MTWFGMSGKLMRGEASIFSWGGNAEGQAYASLTSHQEHPSTGPRGQQGRFFSMVVLGWG